MGCIASAGEIGSEESAGLGQGRRGRKDLGSGIDSRWQLRCNTQACIDCPRAGAEPGIWQRPDSLGGSANDKDSVVSFQRSPCPVLHLRQAPDKEGLIASWREMQSFAKGEKNKALPQCGNFEGVAWVIKSKLASHTLDSLLVTKPAS